MKESSLYSTFSGFEIDEDVSNIASVEVFCIRKACGPKHRRWDAPDRRD
jgi:hypothetical protein